MNVDLKVKVSTDPNATGEDLNLGEAREQGYFVLAEEDLRSVSINFNKSLPPTVIDCLINV